MTESTQTETFKSWGLLELFGHQRLAGELSEQTIGGCHFIRIDVPALDDIPTYTRYFTQGAIYGMTPMAEATARKLAYHHRAIIIRAWEVISTLEAENAAEQELLDALKDDMKMAAGIKPLVPGSLI